MTERVQKLIAAGGACSRRTAEEWIRAGRVTVNGRRVSLGDRADPDTDIIAVDGRAVNARARKVYLMLHKPRGFVTTLSDERGRRTAAELVRGCGTRVYPVGRLDMDSEGLLLFTNDGEFANRMTHPRQELDKVYEVWVNRYTPGAQRELAKPVVLDGYKIRPPKGRKSPLSAVQQESGVAGKQRKHRPVDDFGLFLKMQSHLTGLVRVVCLQGDLQKLIFFFGKAESDFYPSVGLGDRGNRHLHSLILEGEVPKCAFQTFGPDISGNLAFKGRGHRFSLVGDPEGSAPFLPLRARSKGHISGVL